MNKTKKDYTFLLKIKIKICCSSSCLPSFHDRSRDEWLAPQLEVACNRALYMIFVHITKYIKTKKLVFSLGNLHKFALDRVFPSVFCYFRDPGHFAFLITFCMVTTSPCGSVGIATLQIAKLRVCQTPPWAIPGPSWGHLGANLAPNISQKPPKMSPGPFKVRLMIYSFLIVLLVLGDHFGTRKVHESL